MAQWLRYLFGEKLQLKYFICDVDGCLNDGKIYWGSNGKMFKVFGSHDHDGIKLLKQHLQIKFITADEAGWGISYNRIVEHMNLELHLVKEKDRYQWVEKHDFDQIAYMGDGVYDAKIIHASKLGIAPKQARVEARSAANYVTLNPGSNGAVMDACLFILNFMGIKYEF